MNWIEDFNKQFVSVDKNGNEVWTIQNFSDPRHVKQFFSDALSKKRLETLDEIRIAICEHFKGKTVGGMIKAAFNDHPKISRKLLIISVRDRVWGGIRGNLLQIIDDLRANI